MSTSTAKKAHALDDYTGFLALLCDLGVENVAIGGCAVGAYAHLIGETVLSGDLDLLVSGATLSMLAVTAMPPEPLARLHPDFCFLAHRGTSHDGPARCPGASTAHLADLDAAMPSRAAGEVLAQTRCMNTALDRSAPSTRMHQFPTVGQYMTDSPHTIGRAQPLSAARRLMHTHGIRHLPVLDGGRIAGLLSERDLFLVESFPGINPTEVLVEEAMMENVHVVDPETPLAEAIAPMIDRKLGSAVVADEGRVVGILTTVDVLRALSDRLQAPED